MGEKSDDRQTDLFYGDNCIYRCILTNDWDSTEQEVIEYYNQRGSSEQTFDIQNNDISTLRQAQWPQAQWPFRMGSFTLFWYEPQYGLPDNNGNG